MVFLDLGWSRCNPPSTFYAPKDRYGRHDHYALLGRFRRLQGFVHSELGLQVRVVAPTVLPWHCAFCCYPTAPKSVTSFLLRYFQLLLSRSVNIDFSRYFSEGLVDPIAVTAGIVQTILYIDFFYIYFTKWVHVFLLFSSPSWLFPSLGFCKVKNSSCQHKVSYDPSNEWIGLYSTPNMFAWVIYSPALETESSVPVLCNRNSGFRSAFYRKVETEINLERSLKPMNREQNDPSVQ